MLRWRFGEQLKGTDTGNALKGGVLRLQDLVCEGDGCLADYIESQKQREPGRFFECLEILKKPDSECRIEDAFAALQRQ